jgi:hypothetical protein
MCIAIGVGMPFCANSSLMLPFCPSADEPLSLQAHPSAQQAVEGFGMSGSQARVDDLHLAGKPLGTRGQFVSLAAAGRRGIVQRKHLQPRVPFEHLAHSGKGAGRISVDREHGTIILEMKVIGQ